MGGLEACCLGNPPELAEKERERESVWLLGSRGWSFFCVVCGAEQNWRLCGVLCSKSTPSFPPLSVAAILFSVCFFALVLLARVFRERSSRPSPRSACRSRPYLAGR